MRAIDLSGAEFNVRVADFVPPVIVTSVWALTAVVVTVNVPVFWLAATVTVAGTLASALLLNRLTTTPPVGAGPAKVTVPVEGLPPMTVAGLSASDWTVVGFTVRVALCVAAPSVPFIVAITAADTGVVAMVNPVDLDPVATVTLVGRLALVLLEVKPIASPPVGAGPVRLTVPIDEVPPITDVGETVTLNKLGG